MKKIGLLIVFCFFISACTLYSINSEDVTLDYHPAKTSSEEITYIDDVRQQYTVIGQVTINAERRQYLKRVIEKMVEEAAWLGGDALTNMRTNSGTGKWVSIKPKLLENSNVRANFIADVIVFNK